MKTYCKFYRELPNGELVFEQAVELELVKKSYVKKHRLEQNKQTKQHYFMSRR